MTTAEIIKHLQGFPPETLVVQSTDPEGNSFSPVFCIEHMDYLPDSPLRGDGWVQNEPNQKRPDGVVTAVVLWPSS